MATLTQQDRDEAVRDFNKRIWAYRAQLLAADHAANPWLTTAERNSIRFVVQNLPAGGVGRAATS